MSASADISASTEAAETAKTPETPEGGRIAACFERLRGENRAGLVTFITGGDPDAATSQALLEGLAEAVKDRLDDETAPPIVLGEVIHTLFEREGLRGNKESYRDPRNSFINDVLDRRLGIPLTLGIILLEVGWRLDLPLEGVSFPGHFLVRYRGAAEHLLIDPFDGGRIRFENQAQEVLDQEYGGMVRMQPAFLRAASKLDMIRRLLVNLKGLYVVVKDDERALSVVERLLLVHPASPEERRDRGMLLLRLGREEEAKEQLRRYLDLALGADDADQIRLLVRGLASPEEEANG